MPHVRFCSSCGAALPGRPPVACPVCGVQHWRNPKPCASGVVVRDGEVLLVRRARAPWKAAWSAPGGFCEAGEHPVETVGRETLEETGYDVEVTGYIGVWVDEYAEAPGGADAETINVAYYHAVVAGRPPADADDPEVSEVRWFGWDELPAALAPPETLATVLDAARRAHVAGTTVGELPDVPSRSRTRPR